MSNKKRDFIPIDKDPIQMVTQKYRRNLLSYNMIFHSDKWEEVPTEDLWEDGEISNTTCMVKIYDNVVVEGKWKLIRQVEKDIDYSTNSSIKKEKK
ncbi:MAG: hypothetical protein Unbinned3338contig1000_33 [Prokaryotic dsDNA virus sp.]|nr:MAG: hypothetical protein Unbinned3338contig1000_33 [Prokaryotic dsDNA virus sp.]